MYIFSEEETKNYSSYTNFEVVVDFLRDTHKFFQRILLFWSASALMGVGCYKNFFHYSDSFCFFFGVGWKNHLRWTG